MASRRQPLLIDIISSSAYYNTVTIDSGFLKAYSFLNVK